MLEEIRIRGLGVIEDAVLELGPGLTVVTGETGAGKTMVVSGLGLLFGGRGDSGSVRPGTVAALVEGRVRVGAGSPARARAEEAGAELDDDVLLLSRSVSAEGRSRATVGGRAAPVALLGELAEDLLAVHGQSDQQRLLRPARQRAALDRWAGAAVQEPLGRYRAARERWLEVAAVASDLRTHAQERSREAVLLRRGLDEVAAVAPLEGEDTALAAEDQRLAHADALRSAAEAAHGALTGDTDSADPQAADATALLGAARRALGSVAGHDPALDALGERVAELGYLLADAAADLAAYAFSVDTDPARLAAVAERRAVLSALARTRGGSLAQVLAWAEGASQRLLDLDGGDERVERLHAEEESLRGEVTALANQVTAARRAAALSFAAAVQAELRDLAMPKAAVTVAVDQQSDPHGVEVDGRAVAHGPDGVDDVEIRLAGHPGATPRALARGASGGELSRVMLAVEVVFAGADPVPTLVFDEVDAGVGGRAAAQVGARLARLAGTAQVLVVTHLPQVAAYADSHLLVVKADDGTVTSSGVRRLDDQERVGELARMLAGVEESTAARAHAEELLARARRA